MKVCACGQVMPRGAGWCHKCYLFWSAWWLRYVNDTCDCDDCAQRRRLQPMVDAAETRASRAVRGLSNDD